MTRRWRECGSLCAALVLLAATAGGCAATADRSSQETRWSAAVPTPTAGGWEFWSDLHVLRDWRIQRHATTNECRLLDGYEWQHASGTFEECLARLAQVKHEEQLEPQQGKAVLLLHGLAAPRWSLHLLGKHLHEEGGYEIVNVQYASTRLGVDEHARSLASVIRSLPDFQELNLVGHSMGNIVIRRYLAGDEDPEHGWQPDPRIRRIVMIAPPNHGASTAVRLADYRLFQTVFGVPGRQLGVEWDDLKSRLATPRQEFGIIAGGKGNDRGYSAKLPGDDDGRLEVTTTRLAGASDFAVVPMLHEFIGHSSQVYEYTLRFLQEGYFISPEKCSPVLEEGIQSPELPEPEGILASWWKPKPVR
jgi:triacylglycerol lipase